MDHDRYKSLTAEDFVNLKFPKILCPNRNKYLRAEEMILKNIKEKSHRITPLMVTLYENILTEIDIKNFIEMGLHIVRIRMTPLNINEKLKLLKTMKNAQAWVCEKYDVSTWPIAICLDMPNAAIRSGYKDPDIKTSIYLKQGAKVQITCRLEYWNRCNDGTVYIDDPYTIQIIRPGHEITLCGGGVKLICVELIDRKSIICEVIRAGFLGNSEFVAVRGIKYKRPPVSKYDQELLKIAKEHQFDVITVFSVRFPSTPRKVKELNGKDYTPLILATICDQEGLDNIEGIIEAADGIILAREFLTHQLVNRAALAAIQMKICAMCRSVGKPFLISGNILEATLKHGNVSTSDISDITNAVIQGAGLVLRSFNDANNAYKAMKIINNVCISVESSDTEDEFKRIVDEFKVPVNAGEASVLGCALMVRQTNSFVVIIPTVTGRTAIQLAHMAPMAVIVTISRNASVAKKMQMYRGVYAIIYDKPPIKNWYKEMDARISFALAYALKKEILHYGQSYVTLRKSAPTSSFCDYVSVSTINQ